MRKLILNDGTEYQLDWGYSDRGIANFNIITDSSFTELATEFSNPSATSKIIARFDENQETVHEGFTELRSISYGGWSSNSVLITLAIPEQIR